MFTLYIPAGGGRPFAARWTTGGEYRYYDRITLSSLARLLRHADLSTVQVHPSYGNVLVDIV